MLQASLVGAVSIDVEAPPAHPRRGLQLGRRD
jgi:hypothetical protein